MPAFPLALLAWLQGPASVTAHGAGAVMLLDEAARLGSAVVAGAALGLNRNLRGKAAGVRTHALVSLGAALVTTAAAHAAAGTPEAATRVIQGVITGVGFLGAGLILHPRSAEPASPPSGALPEATTDGRDAYPGRGTRSPAVRGLTTAASVWVAAALGMACGLGLWSLALLGAVLTLAVLTGGGAVERAARQSIRRRARAA